jgi:hypothetical protein
MQIEWWWYSNVERGGEFECTIMVHIPIGNSPIGIKKQI